MNRTLTDDEWQMLCVLSDKGLKFIDVEGWKRYWIKREDAVALVKKIDKIDDEIRGW
jgi:hypothetical protein